jgi:hypothetical protein
MTARNSKAGSGRVVSFWLSGYEVAQLELSAKNLGVSRNAALRRLIADYAPPSPFSTDEAKDQMSDHSV